MEPKVSKEQTMDFIDNWWDIFQLCGTRCVVMEPAVMLILELPSPRCASSLPHLCLISARHHSQHRASSHGHQRQLCLSLIISWEGRASHFTAPARLKPLHTVYPSPPTICSVLPNSFSCCRAPDVHHGKRVGGGRWLLVEKENFMSAVTSSGFVPQDLTRFKTTVHMTPWASIWPTSTHGEMFVSCQNIVKHLQIPSSVILISVWKNEVKKHSVFRIRWIIFGGVTRTACDTIEHVALEAAQLM